MFVLRSLRRRPTEPPAPPPAVPAHAALDRSTLLAELEVAVPAPERLVRWDTAVGAGRSREDD